MSRRDRWLLLARRARVTIAFSVLLIAAACAVGSAWAPISLRSVDVWAVNVPAVFARGHWWALVSGWVVAPGPVQLVLALAATIGAMGWAERRMGSRRTLYLAAVGSVVATVTAALIQHLAHSVDAWWPGDVQGQRTLDPMLPAIITVAAASAFAGPLWRRRTRVLVVAFVTVFALYNGDASDVYRLTALGIGLAAGSILARRARKHAAPQRPSFSERRFLLAIVTALTALGPAIAAVNPRGDGVLSLFASIFGDPFPTAGDVRQACASESALACDHDRAFLELHGSAPILMLFVPLVLLLIAAWGLKRGSRFALWTAIVVNLTLAALSVGTLLVIGDLGAGLSGSTVFDAIQLVLWIAGPVGTPIALAILLFTQRRVFDVASSGRRVIEFWSLGVVAFIVLGGVYALVGSMHLHTYLPAASFRDVLADAPMRFVPVNFLVSYRGVFFPRDPATRILFHWTGPVWWAIVMVLLVRVVIAPALGTVASVAPEVRLLLRRGAGTLGHMATWPHNRIWFTDDRTGAVAYRLVGGVAVTVSDPLCAPKALDSTIAGFLRFCDEQAWTPAFYSVHAPCRRALGRLGFRSTAVAAEALIDLSAFQTSGKAGQSIRTALNRAKRDGTEAVWSSYAELSSFWRAELAELSEQWSASKSLPEMGFTLGGLDELRDPDVRVMLAVSREGRVLAVTSWLPVYHDGHITGWTLDLMRRAPDSPGGVMEFLIASAAIHMQDTGASVLSLSAAPLARSPEVESAPTAAVDQLLGFLGRRLEPAYGFASLLRYKDKFRPRYEDLFLCYRDALVLPTIGRAIAGAYLPDAGAGQIVALIRAVLSHRNARTPAGPPG